MLKFTAVVVAITALIVISPLFSAFMFLIGAFVGWLMANVFTFFGVWVVSGVALFGIHIELANLPLFIATLGFIGSFFKTYQSSK